MNIKKIALLWLIALSSLSLLNSCSDDPASPLDSSLTEEDGVKTSSFAVDASLWGIENLKGDKFELVLVPDGVDTMLSFAASLRRENEKVRCRFTLPHPRKIDDGVYILYIFAADGSRLGHPLKVSIKEDRLHELLSVPQFYKPMSGSGTAEDPYIIAKQTDFLNLIVELDNEQGVHGKGLHYLQTADVEVPPQSSMTTGRGYYSTPFAGHYNGGGFRLTGLSYTGALNIERDSNIGLFSRLLSGAVVENVKIEGLDISSAMACGAIAGSTSGTVTLRNISATGNINSAGNNVGGLVGIAVDTLIVDGYEMNMTLSGQNNVGGVVGSHTSLKGALLQVKNLSTAKHHFRITGTGNVGGVAGKAEGQVILENISIDHSVQSEDQDVSIITATNSACAGGLFGELAINRESTLKNLEILAPVSGSENVGGLAGKCSVMRQLTLDGCKVSTIITGSENTGGFFGWFIYQSGTTPHSLIFSGNTSKLITDFNAGEVRGGEKTGGLAGRYEGSVPEFKAAFNIAMNITATGDETGGLFGFLSNDIGLTLDLSNVNFSSSTMKISSNGGYVGGVAGYMSSYSMKAPGSFSLHKETQAVATDIDALKPFFCVVVEGKEHVGGVAGRAVECSIEGFILAVSVTGSSYVGGIVGDCESPKKLAACAMQSKSSVYSTGDFCGGIAGSIMVHSNSSVYDCINRAPVTGADYTGGIMGKVYYGADFNPSWLVNTGKITAKGSAGGIVGRAEGDYKKFIVQYSANYGNVSTSFSGGSGAGGIIGCSHSQRVHLMNCANHALIDAGGSGGAVGGVAGCLGHDPSGVSQSENLLIAYCMNSGEVRSSDRSKNVGGILGFQEEGTSGKNENYCVRDCYNDGHISSDQDADNGGLVGKVSHYSFLLRSVNYGKVDYGNACIGTRQSSAQFYCDYVYYKEGTGKSWGSSGSIPENSLSDQSHYPTYDFQNTWQISNGRAELRNCPWQNLRTYQ